MHALEHSALGRPAVVQEAPLSPSDRAMRLVSSRPNLANCHAIVQKLLNTTSPDQTDGMKLEV